ncbi:MAG: outer membrane lipoprotein-sorting protein [Proteobacteria bacterium]|nr:outer membrane lipoprotein-sorting protein [Pseudomonadota bacterium]
MKRQPTSKKGPILLAWAIFAMSLQATGDVKNPPDRNSKEFPIYVMNKIDDQYRGAKSHGIMEMKVKTKHWTRTMSLESWSMGRSYSLVRILKPKKEKGTATLKAKNDLFTYLSKTSRTIKITSGMMGGSWMGSHFTNDDLVRHTRLAEDYVIELTFEGQAAGTDVYRFTLTPKPDAPVVWGKLEITVRQSDLQPLNQVFFDEDGHKVRVLEFSDHKKVGDRVMPMKMFIKPLDKSGEFTMVTWKEIDFNVTLSKSFFSIQRLKSL